MGTIISWMNKRTSAILSEQCSRTMQRVCAISQSEKDREIRSVSKHSIRHSIVVEYRSGPSGLQLLGSRNWNQSLAGGEGRGDGEHIIPRASSCHRLRSRRFEGWASCERFGGVDATRRDAAQSASVSLRRAAEFASQALVFRGRVFPAPALQYEWSALQCSGLEVKLIKHSGRSARLDCSCRALPCRAAPIPAPIHSTARRCDCARVRALFNVYSVFCSFSLAVAVI